MTTYKQWHDDDLTFNSEMKIYFCECDMNHNLALSEILKLTTDYAVEDYHQRGISWKFLADHNVAILVSRIAFRIHRIPKDEEKITIKTWEEKPQPLQLMRNYQILSESGEKLVSGYGAWLLVNPKERKIMRTKDFTLRPETSRQDGHDCMEPGKIAIPSEMKKIGERVIHYSDIDGNGHTNNSRYADFAIDVLPKEYQQKEFTDFRINFSKEAMLGISLELFASFDDDNNKITVVGKQSENTCFECELFYKK